MAKSNNKASGPAKNDQAPPAAAPYDELKEALAQLEEKTKELEEARAVIVDLKAKYDAAVSKEETSSSEVIVKHGNATYKVVIPSFKFQGTTYQAADLKGNKELVASLIKKGSAVLEKIDG